MRILVIDEDALNLKLTRTVLAAGGHEVLSAASATEGFKSLEKELPELIVMDVHLSDMGGFSAIQRLKSNARLRSIPVIALTAMAMKGDRERILQAGFDFYVAKPIRYRELLDLLAGINKRNPDHSGS